MKKLNAHNIFPKKIFECLKKISVSKGSSVYLCGGAVRDRLLGRESFDIDLTVSGSSMDFASQLSRSLKASLVPLAEEEGFVRLVWQGVTIDISSFREGTSSIADDLCRRDFTINAMAIQLFPHAPDNNLDEQIIDPLDGQKDLKKSLIRAASPDVFPKDPLRLLRAYRFSANLNFHIEEKTKEFIRAHYSLINQAAAERITAELEKILQAPLSGKIFTQMAQNGLLWEIFPELHLGQGVLQPSSHHLDVFDHCLETLHQMERLHTCYKNYFPKFHNEISRYLEENRNKHRLKIAALFHDVGKSHSHAIKKGRITFYGHDGVSSDIIENIARRLKWSNEDRRKISLLIKNHMRPFHLNNARKKTGIKPKAYLKLGKAVGDDIIGLFLVAMSDSLAGSGEGKPPEMEEEIASLFEEAYTSYKELIRPVLKTALISGHDLISEFKLKPGPIFGKIIRELDEVRVERPNLTRLEALQWVKNYLNKFEFQYQ